MGGETSEFILSIIRVKSKKMPQKTIESKKTPLTYAQKLALISQKIRRGDQKRISEMTGYSPSYVSYVLNSVYSNQSIVNYAYKIMRPRK